MQFGGWGAIFWALAVFACLCGAAVAVDLLETHPPDRRAREPILSVFPRYAEMIVDRRFIGYAAPASLSLGLIFAYVASAPSMFMQHYGLSPSAFSLVFASNAVGLIGSAQVNRLLSRRYSTHAILRTASLVGAAAGLLLPVLAWTGFGGLPTFAAAIFACLSMLGLILPNATAAVMAPFPEHAGVASALLGTLQFAVGAVTGALVGVFHDGTPRPAAWVMAGCAAGSVAVTLVAERARARSAVAADSPLGACAVAAGGP
jgi:DHA1 family bicyclomycin/chloramphenicol resistance-like MFS transporter